jgi:16S rRNA (guanine527-N7)-methyltransferase
LGRAQDLGFLGPGGLDDKVDHALAFGPLLPAGSADGPPEVLDLGSGGGLPALPLAVARPTERWVLVDSMARRTAFLAEAVARLGLEDRVQVRTARAEALPAEWRGRFAAVTARGFGRPAVLAECAAPWLRVGGALVVSEPPGGRPERWPDAGLDQLGLTRDLLVTGPPSFARLRQAEPCPPRFPRRLGVPAKRPLW